MKKEYNTATVEIINIGQDDVIRASGEDQSDIFDI